MKDQIKKVFRKIIKETPSKLSTKALKRANKINKLNAEAEAARKEVISTSPPPYICTRGGG